MSEKDSGRGGGFLLPRELYANRQAGMESIKRWRREQRAMSAVHALGKTGFDAAYAADRERAREEVFQRIPAGATVGVAGSMTLRELGIPEELKRRGHTLYDHWAPGLSEKEILLVRRAQLTADVFLSSVNAVTLKGQLVSTDGIGNRVAATTFGPGKCILVIGANKIVPTLEAALARIKDVCAPLALHSTGAPLPCVRTGICEDCHSEARMCCATLIMDRRPFHSDISVVIVGEELGL